MKIFNFILSFILIIIITILFGLIMYNYNPLFLIFIPFFLLFYLSIGWGFTKSFKEKQLERLPLRNKIPGLILFTPAYYFIVSCQKMFNK